MSALSDVSICAQIAARKLIIEPFHDQALQPSSYDLTLGPVLLIPGPGQHVELKAGRLPDRHQTVSLALDAYPLRLGCAVLGATAERIVIPNDLVGLLVGRSTIARLFLSVEAAGLLDPGYEGSPTLELVNSGPHTVWLNAGDPICQLLLLRLTTVVERPYGSEGLGSRYQSDSLPTPARAGVLP